MDFSPQSQAPTAGRHVGPPLVPVALISVALFAASLGRRGHRRRGASHLRTTPRATWAGRALSHRPATARTSLGGRHHFAAIAELSPIALTSEPAAVLLLIARSGSLAWLLAAAALLPASRRGTTTTHEGITP
jgi:hypothetical protein